MYLALPLLTPWRVKTGKYFLGPARSGHYRAVGGPWGVPVKMLGLNVSLPLTRGTKDLWFLSITPAAAVVRKHEKNRCAEGYCLSFEHERASPLYLSAPTFQRAHTGSGIFPTPINVLLVLVMPPLWM